MSRFNNMVIDEKKKNARRTLYLVTALVFAVAYSLYCFVTTPLYISATSNVIYDDSIIPTILNILSTVLELFAVSFAYGSVILGIYKFGVSGFMGGFGIFLGATLYKYAANMMLTWYNAGKIPLDFIKDIMNLLFFVAVEMIQLVIVVLIVNKTVSAPREKALYFEKEGIEGEIDAERPINKIYDRKNPLLRAAFYCAAVVFVSKVIGPVYNDLLYIVASGLPRKFLTVILMLVNYLSLTAFGVLCYAFVLLSLMFFKHRKQKM